MARLFPRWLRRLNGAIFRLSTRIFAPNSPWKRLKFPVPVTAFGLGSHRQFAEYFDGESRVPVESIESIIEWLLTCEYATDVDLFHERDVWQHPSAFEELRRGDCEDFALWAWRKLAEIGIDAEFYVGRVVPDGEPDIVRQHAWVMYHVDGAPFLFEPAARTQQQMIRPLADVRNRYVPHFAVDRRFRTWAFRGCLLDSTSDRGRQRQTPPGSRLPQAFLR